MAVLTIKHRAEVVKVRIVGLDAHCKARGHVAPRDIVLDDIHALAQQVVLPLELVHHGGDVTKHVPEDEPTQEQRH